MSDTNEADGVGAADPITGVTGAKDDLAASAQLPDSGVEDGDAEQGSDPSRASGRRGGEAADVASGDHEAIRAESMETVTNDAVAGDTVLPGPGDGNDGPTGGAPGEVTPIQPENELDPGSIDLDDER